MGYNLSAALGAVGIGTVVVLSVVSADEESRPQVKDGETSPQNSQAPVDWKQIWFMDDRPQKIKITLYDMKTVDGQSHLPHMKGLGIAGESALEVETRDPTIVGIFDNALTMPLRVAIPDDPGYGAAGMIYPNLGRIEVFTRKRVILIGINCGGFSLGSETLRQQNRFFSWMIAQQLDDILFLKTERHIPRKTRRALSGEAYIEGGKRNYEIIRREERKVDADTQ